MIDLIKDLTAKEEEFLVKYCMQPENTWLALAIGHIQPLLREAIVAYFLKELNKSVKKELEARGLHWGTCVPETNLEKEEGVIYVMNMKPQDIRIHLGYEKENLFVGIHANETSLPADALRSFLEEEVQKDSVEKNNSYHPWWIYPEESHKRVEVLIALHDDPPRCEKEIEYFTNELVCLAQAMSKAQEA